MYRVKSLKRLSKIKRSIHGLSTDSFLNECLNPESLSKFCSVRGEEVDFVLRKGEALVAIEVKSSLKKDHLSGMKAFKKAYNPQRLLLVGGEGIPIHEFLRLPITDLF